MFSLRHFLVAAGISAGICATVVLFPRCEDPRKLALGDWKGANAPLQAEVTEGLVQWNGPGARGKFAYEWVQADKSPYRVRFTHGRTVVEADIVFDSDNEVVVEPLVYDQLPPMLQEHLRSRNKSLGRPEKELRLNFRRLKPKK